VNKKTDLLSSLNNIKLPLLPSHQNQSWKECQFTSVPLRQSLNFQCEEKIHAHRDLEYKLGAFEHKRTSLDKRLDRELFGSKSPKLRKQISLTEEYCGIYADETAPRTVIQKGDFLVNHKIDHVLRARMLDWMVEVMSSYNFNNRTYFTGVEIMDRFFQNCSEQLQPTQLHIIGIESMFIATKVEEVYPLKLKTVYDKIAHKKIPMEDLLEMEQKILSTLDFSLLSQTFYEECISRITLHLYNLEQFKE
jgi:hypothetical protein